MLKYVLKRVLIFLPTLFIISVFTFALSKMAPGDPVKLALGQKGEGETQGSNEKIANEKAYYDMAEQLGFTLPAFYFSISDASTPDTMYKFIKRPERECLERLISMYGNWPAIEDYYHKTRKLEYAVFDAKQDSTTFEPGRVIRTNCEKLHIEYADDDISLYLSEIIAASKLSPNFKEVNKLAMELNDSYLNIKNTAKKSNAYIPSFHWYGTKNQYHRWLTNFLMLDFGISYQDKRPVWSKIKDALPWTLLINFITIALAYIIAIPLGVYAARYHKSLFDRVSTFILFLMYSLPGFWVATLAVIFLTTSEYGMDLFPTFGLGDVTDDMSWWEVFVERGYHLLLPTLVILTRSLAYLSRQMRGSILSVVRADFIRTARAKGLGEQVILWKHAFRNSLIPIIVLFGGIFPASVSGAFIIEIIFAIPGMGQLSFAGLVARDYPMVFAVLMITAVLTLVGTLVSDILYAAVDPRISFK